MDLDTGFSEIVAGDGIAERSISLQGKVQFKMESQTQSLKDILQNLEEADAGGYVGTQEMLLTGDL